MRTNRCLSGSKLTEILICLSFGFLYFYGLLLSDSALYVKVVDPSTSNDANGFHEKNLVTLRSLPHLRTVNTLALYKSREEKRNKRKNKNTKVPSDQAPTEGLKEANRTQDAINTADDEGGAKKGGAKKGRTSEKLSMVSIIAPFIALFMISLGCRCLLALLIYRHSNQIQEFDFDSAGQIRRTSRLRPANERVSFWQVFRTIPTRTSRRTTTLQQHQEPQRQNLNRQLFIELTNRLNEQRIRNGSRPLGEESMAFLLSNNRAIENFSGNDYDELWTIQEENGNASPIEADVPRGVTDEELARYPVRYLEQGDDLIQDISSDTGLDSMNFIQEDQKCAICLEVFEIGDMVRTIPCFHSFHGHCIDPWLREKATCPICKHVTTI